MLLAIAFGNSNLHWLSNYCKSVRASAKPDCSIRYDCTDGRRRKKTNGLYVIYFEVKVQSDCIAACF